MDSHGTGAMLPGQLRLMLSAALSATTTDHLTTYTRALGA